MKSKVINSIKLGIAVLAMSLMAVTSCTKMEDNNISYLETEYQNSPERAMEDFSIIMSKALYSSPQLRAAVKQAALEQFDNDYDILYARIKETKISNGKDFRDCLLEFTSEETLTAIERSLPLLTMYIPDLTWLDKDAFNIDKWDVDSEEIVVTYRDNGLCKKVFADGLLVEELEPGAFPACATVIVKNNERLRYRRGTKSGEIEYSFTYDEFDGAKNNTKYWHPFDPEVSYQYYTLSSTSDSLPANLLPNSSSFAVDAFNNLKNTPAASQRDYCYYNMTPSQPSGTYNTNVLDRLFRFKVNGSSLYSICDTEGDGGLTTFEHSGSKYGANEMLSAVWADGNLEIVMRIYNSSHPKGYLDYPFNVRPQDIFQISRIKIEFWHSTAVKWYQSWRYSVPNTSVRSKWYYPSSNVYLPSWNLYDNPYMMSFSFFEQDASEEVTNTITLTEKYTNKQDFNAELEKIKWGVSTSEESTVTKTITTTRKAGSDSLGELSWEYTNPYLLSTYEGGYTLFSKSNGSITICVLPTRL